MNEHYHEIIDDLKRGISTPALLKQAAKSIKELLTIHQLDQSEIVRLRRQIEMMERSKDA